MCGISAIISPNGATIARSLKSMTDVIKHRGPDDEGFLCLTDTGQLIPAAGETTSEAVIISSYPYTPKCALSELYEQKIKIGLGHRRLAIIDLSAAGHTPMCYDDSRYWITYNGEVYNYIELRAELEQNGHSFITQSDTEVILAAYAHWGKECLHKLVGMWAFVIYDHLKQEIFVARDRFGIKPVYYWHSPAGNLHFASEIKQFTVVEGWKAVVNPQRAYDYLIYSLTDHTEETMFKGVYQIPPGHYYYAGIEDTLKPGYVLPLTKWYTMPTAPKFPGSFDEATGIFKEHFINAVRVHLRSDVPVGTALSGGLDSSSIVCVMNELLKEQDLTAIQKTFSSCSDYAQYDEKKWCDLVIEKTKVEAHFVYPKLEDVFRLTPDLIWYQDEPYQSQSAFLGYHVFQMAKENNVTVLLNGQGADEYLGGYGQFTIPMYAKMFSSLNWKGIFKDIQGSKTVRQISYPAVIKGIIYQMLPYGIRRKFYKHGYSYRHVNKLINSEKLGASTDMHPYDVIPVKLDNVEDAVKHYTFFSSLPKYLRWEDRNSMAHSIEARVPFLDHRLFEFCCTLPVAYMEKEGLRKTVFRSAMQGILPESVRNRKDKMGFTTPEEKWVKSENPELFKLKMKEAIQTCAGIINEDAMDYMNKMLNSEVPFDTTYWRLLMFAEWVKRFKVNLTEIGE